MASGTTLAIQAHGLAVGLPTNGDMGNSEVGHNTMGAGRILDQGATRVEKALGSGAIWGTVWREVVDHVRSRESTLHLLGLLSDGNVHSHVDHLEKLILRAQQEGLTRIRLHVLLDGRDVPDGSADTYVTRIEDFLAACAGPGDDFRIASGGGRMEITMDRYGANWGMVERGWKAHVLGDAASFPDALAAISEARRENPAISDQYLPPFVVSDESGPVGRVHSHDAVVCFNFRGDRAIEISRAFTEGDFSEFDRQLPTDLLYAGLLLYDGDTDMPPKRLIEPEPVVNTVSERLAASGVSQFACAETQKYGHVTFFWNGNRSSKFDDASEEYREIPSETRPFSERPWMKSAETADMVCEAIESGHFQFIRTNFAGGDMVGHTGDFQATVIALEAIDLAVRRIREAVRKHRGCLVLTADHGNADDMVERNAKGEPIRAESGSVIAKTSHSLAPVPFAVEDFSNRHIRVVQVPDPGLANLAASLCTLLGLEPPPEYAPSLVSVVDVQRGKQDGT